MKGLGGSHVNSIGKGGNDKTWAISEIFVTVVENGISNLNDEGGFLNFLKVVDLKLGLPLEFFGVVDLLDVELFDNITGVSIHGNQATNFLTHGSGKITLHQLNQVRE